MAQRNGRKNFRAQDDDERLAILDELDQSGRSALSLVSVSLNLLRTAECRAIQQTRSAHLTPHDLAAKARAPLSSSEKTP